MIRIGPAGWSYEDWEGIVYPLKKGAKFDPLAYLAGFFDTIELNNTFYRPPTPQMGKSWAKRVESNPRFKFTAKLFRNFTHLPKSLTESDEADFKKGLAPLVESGRLGALLIQFAQSFRNTRENWALLRDVTGKFREYPLVLEVRHESWDRAPLYDFLRENSIAFCNIDQPPVEDTIGITNKVTSPTGYLRLHGRNVKNWLRKDAGRNAKYDYLYNRFEMFEISEKVREIGQKAEEAFVIFNNHYHGQAVCNALEMKARLGEKLPELPETLLQHYPQLKELEETNMKDEG